MTQDGRFLCRREDGFPLEITSAGLHLLAMFFMLLDHMWATVLSWNWMTCVGRLAFPIFAFMAVEGYFHTRSFRRYLLRLLVFAVVSEIPFNLMYGSSILYPYHQNVIWTFLLSLACIRLIEAAKATGKGWIYIAAAVGATGAGCLLGYLLMPDYYGAGVLTVLTFYFFRGKRWWCLLGQALALYWINVELLQGLFYTVSVFGMELEIAQQGLAVLALIPIWMYRGKQGLHSKAFQYLCYGFYPVHMLVLVGILRIMQR